MPLNLDNLFGNSTQDSTGVGKDSTGAVTVQSSGSQPIQLQNSANTTALQVNNDASVNLSAGVSVNEIVNSFNDGTTNKNVKLATVQAIIDYATSVSSGVKQYNFNTLASFNAYTFTEEMLPAQVYINDTVTFTFTDSYGKTVTGVDWVFVFIHWEVSAAEKHLLSSSADSTRMTGQEIKDALFLVADTNNFSNAYKSKLDNAPANINTSLSTLTTNTSSNSTAISNLQSGKANLNAANTFTQYNTFQDNSNSQISIRPSSSGFTSGLAFRDFASNLFKSGIGYDESTGTFFITTGSGTGFSTLPQRLTLNTTTANFLVNLQKNGVDVLTTDAITTSITDATGKVPTAATVKTYVDGNITTFNGGTLTNNLVLSGGVSNQNMLTLKRTVDTISQGFAWQNAANNYIKSIYVDQSDGDKLTISQGSNASASALTKVLTLDSSANVNILNGGSLTAAGLVKGNTLEVTSTSTFNAPALIKSDTLPQLTLKTSTNLQKAGLAFQDETTNYKAGLVYDDTDSTLKVYLGSNATFSSITNVALFNQYDLLLKTVNLIVQRGKLVGTYNASHTDTGSTTTRFGSIIDPGFVFVGMQINTSFNGSQNDEDLEFYVRNGTTSYGRALKLAKDKRATFDGAVDVTGYTQLSSLGVSGTCSFATVTTSGTTTLNGSLVTNGSASMSALTVFNDIFSGSILQNKVLTGANIGQECLQVLYHTTFPSLTSTIISGWFARGQHVYFIGVPTGTITLPQIVSSGATSTQVNVGQQIRISNFNNATNLTLAFFSGQKLVVDSFSQIFTTSQNIFSASTVTVVAMDLRTYTPVSAYAWMIIGQTHG